MMINDICYDSHDTHSFLLQNCYNNSSSPPPAAVTAAMPTKDITTAVSPWFLTKCLPPTDMVSLKIRIIGGDTMGIPLPNWNGMNTTRGI